MRFAIAAAHATPSRPPRIGTHDGIFHCDEVLGCWLLKKTERFKNAQVVRTRDQKVLKELDVVVDVGGVYDPELCRFDHHQKGFDEIYGRGHTVKLSSAGLIYRHFGEEILKNIVHPMELNERELDSLTLRVYKGIVECIDAIDNGLSICTVKCAMRYQDGTGLPGRISRLNPPWNNTDPEVHENGQFAKAMELCGELFTEYVLDAAQRWLPGRALVREAFDERFAYSPDGDILFLPITCPWKNHLEEIENDQNVFGITKYCVYEGVDNSYRVQAVPVAPESFTPRMRLPAEWRGLSGRALEQECGVEDSMFVHPNGFIGGHKTKEGALEMARLALKLSENQYRFHSKNY